jgi:hypothetical protein
MTLQINLINNQVNNNEAAKNCVTSKKIKIPTKWCSILLWFIFFMIVNHNLVNFANGYAVDTKVRLKRVIFPKIDPTSLTDTVKESIETVEPAAAENIEIKFPGGGIINAKGIFTMGLISATAALLFVCDHLAKVIMCIIRRLNNTDGNEIEIQMEDRR